MRRSFRLIALFGTLLAMVSTLVALAAPPAQATQPSPHRVTICHRTNSVTNPYVRITVDVASVDGNTGNDNGRGDHLAQHQGPVFDVTADPAVAYPPPHNGDQWGDIIPPFYEDGSTLTGYPSLNWDDAGMAIFNAGCAIPNQPPTGSITVTKTIDGHIIEGDEVTRIHFVITNENGDPTVAADVVGECDFEFDASTPLTGDLLELSQECVGNLPYGTYWVWETDSDGFVNAWVDANGDPTYLAVTVDADTPNITVTVNNTFTPASAEACKIADANGTGFSATGQTFAFDLVMVSDPSGRYTGDYTDVNGDPIIDGSVLETESVIYDATAETNCVSFSTTILDNVTYRIVEESAGSAWTTTGGGTDFTAQYPADANALFTRTFTNTLKPAYARVCKVTTVVNGYGFDPTTAAFTFDLRTGSATGTVVDTQTVAGGGTATTPVCASFTPKLQDGTTYFVTEQSASPWTTQAPSPISFTPSYPGDADKTFTVTYTNTRTFSAPLTPGYWKNHLAQVRPLLTQTLGTFSVSSTSIATSIYNVMNCNNVTTNTQNAIGCLAGHLLSTKLNIANGSDGTCIAPTVTAADNFLKAMPRTGSPSTMAYIGPSGDYSKITAAGRSTAVTLKTALDKYNNAGGC